MESWILSARFALRRLARRPTYALLAVGTLALGVGGAAAIFSLARGFLVDPLPYAQEGELGVFWNPHNWSEAEFTVVREVTAGFRGVAAYRPGDATLDPGNGQVRFVPGIAASAELFEVLGVRPMLGPGFQPGDDVVGAEPVVVLSHRLWRELGRDPGIVGQPLRLDGAERTVVGVMPRGFWFPDPGVEMWTTTPVRPDNQVGMYAFVGRVGPGARMTAMDAELARVTTALGEQFTYLPEWDNTRDAELTPVREYLVGPVRPALIATLAAMAALLLIACANVAALMLGQVDARSTEMAVRSALGAGQRRLLQQITAEALVIGAMAGAVGALFAAGAFHVLVAALPLGAMAEAASLDWALFWGAMAIAVVAALAVSVAPSLSTWRAQPQETLSGGRTGGVRGRGGRVEQGLVVGQVALAVVMVAGAALVLQSVDNLRAIDPGVDTERIAVVDVVIPGTVIGDERRQMVRDALMELEALPGAAAVGMSQVLPLRRRGDNWGVEIEGQPEADGARTTAVRLVAGDYFEAMGFRVRAGRGFERADQREDAEPVAVINEAMAREFFPGEDPVGRQISSGISSKRIVGVVEDVLEGGLLDGPAPARYLLMEQIPGTAQTQAFVLRARPGVDEAALLDAARAAIGRAAPGMAVQGTTTMERVFAQAIGPAGQLVSLLSLLALVALALGAIGVYGIVSHLVLRRIRDWGIRIALGLQPRFVLRQVVARGSALVAVGIAVGIGVFLVASRVLTAFLYEVGTADPLAIGSAALLLLTAGAVAALVPAWRASRIDPGVVLREQ